MKRWIGAAAAVGVLCLVMISTAPASGAAELSARPVSSERAAHRSGLDRRRFADHLYDPRHDPHYYARPYFYRPYPYSVPFPFVFGFGPWR